MMKDNTNSGFSLIELIIAMTILLVLSGMIFLGSDSARRKETEKYPGERGKGIRGVRRRILGEPVRESQTGACRRG